MLPTLCPPAICSPFLGKWREHITQDFLAHHNCLPGVLPRSKRSSAVAVGQTGHCAMPMCAHGAEKKDAPALLKLLGASGESNNQADDHSSNDGSNFQGLLWDFQHGVEVPNFLMSLVPVS